MHVRSGPFWSSVPYNEALACAFFGLFGIAEYLFADDLFRRFVEIGVQSSLEFQVLGPKGGLDECPRSPHHDRCVALARIAIWLEFVAAAQSGKQQTAPTIGKRELHFNRGFHLFRNAQSGKHTLAGGSCSLALASCRRALEERGDLAQFFSKFFFRGHSASIEESTATDCGKRGFYWTVCHFF